MTKDCINKLKGRNSLNINMNKKIDERYFKWICDLINEKNHDISMYMALLKYLHNKNFYYILPMDGNRAEDGIELRYRFGYENNYNEGIIASYIDISPCSVLEMMIALSIRCEEHIMEDDDIGDRTSKWFWTMIKNLDLECMDDEHYDEYYVDEVISIFLERDYERNGKGGLFTVNNCREDLRNVEIWYQMCKYLNGA